MTREESIERIKMILEESTTNEDAVSYVTSDDADALGMAIKALEREPILDKIKAEIIEEKDFAYCDFEQYKVECLGVDADYVEDELPNDDFRYGMERAIEIINKYKEEM